MFPIESLYWWKGKIVDGKEYVILAKTLNKNVDKVRKEVRKMHSYEIPCIININCGANDNCLDWVKKEVR